MHFLPGIVGRIADSAFLSRQGRHLTRKIPLNIGRHQIDQMRIDRNMGIHQRIGIFRHGAVTTREFRSRNTVTDGTGFVLALHFGLGSCKSCQRCLHANQGTQYMGRFVLSNRRVRRVLQFAIGHLFQMQTNGTQVFAGNPEEAIKQIARHQQRQQTKTGNQAVVTQ